MASRLWQILATQRPQIFAATLLGAALVAASSIGQASVVVLQSSIDENWRGAYDLLITAGGDSGGTESPLSTGLVEQNFVSLADGAKISAAQLEAIRDTDGVELAAPLAFVGQLTSPAYGVLVGGSTSTEPGREEFFSEKPHAYAIEVTVSAGAAPLTQDLQRVSTSFVVGRSMDQPVAVATYGTVSTATSGDGVWSADVTLPGVPELSSGLVAVDPAAETELLGENGGFLAQLVSSESLTPQALANLVDPERFEYEHFSLLNAPANAITLPVVVNESSYTQVEAQVSITPIDLLDAQFSEIAATTNGIPSGLSPEGETVLAQSQRGESTLQTIDLTHKLVPFALPELSITLPGAETSPGGTAIESSPALTPWVASGLDLTEAGAPSATAGMGYQASPRGQAALTADASEQTYRESNARPAPTQQSLFAPVGTYDPVTEPIDAGDASYVPFGTYANGTAIVSDSRWSGALVGPSFSGRGSVLSAPGAVTTFDAARQLYPTIGIDIVRARVSDVGGFSTSAVDRIERIASKIVALGLDVRVVAGSSLGTVPIYLPSYFEDGDDLGWTLQEWTTLGAAVRVESASVEGLTALIIVALTATVVLAGQALIQLTRRRRGQRELLSNLGWTRGAIWRRFLTEHVVEVAIVAVSAAVVVASSTWAAARLAAILAPLVYVGFVIAASGVTIAWPRSTPRSVSSRASITTVRQLSRRLAGDNPEASAAVATALIVLGLGVGSFIVALSRWMVDAGSTRLAAVVRSDLLPPAIVLMLCAAAAAVGLFVSGTREMTRASSAQYRSLSWVGWETSTIQRIARSALLWSCLPAAVITVAAALTFAALVGANVFATGAATVLLLIVAIGIAFFASYRSVRKALV